MTLAVTSCVLPSVSVPVALNACDVPRAKEALAGVTAIETSAGCATASAAVPEIAPEVAVIVAFPMPAPVANPVAPTVATPGAEDVQVAPLVRSWVLPSE